MIDKERLLQDIQDHFSQDQTALRKEYCYPLMDIIRVIRSNTQIEVKTPPQDDENND
jgi:hypothetical protein